MLENDSNFSSECLTSLSFQDNEGLILLGLAGTTENQGRVYAGPSHTKPEPHTRGASLRRLRRYTKQDLLVSFNSCFFSVLLSLKYPGCVSAVVDLFSVYSCVFLKTGVSSSLQSSAKLSMQVFYFFLLHQDTFGLF